jgi:hypothetical protein
MDGQRAYIGMSRAYLILEVVNETLPHLIQTSRRKSVVLSRYTSQVELNTLVSKHCRNISENIG